MGGGGSAAPQRSSSCWPALEGVAHPAAWAQSPASVPRRSVTLGAFRPRLGLAVTVVTQVGRCPQAKRVKDAQPEESRPAATLAAP